MVKLLETGIFKIMPDLQLLAKKVGNSDSHVWYEDDDEGHDKLRDGDERAIDGPRGSLPGLGAATLSGLRVGVHVHVVGVRCGEHHAKGQGTHGLERKKTERVPQISKCLSTRSKYSLANIDF